MYLYRVLFLLSLFAACKGRERTQPTNRTEVTAPQKASVHWPTSFGWGQPATAKLIQEEDIDIHPDGRGLPAGQGNAIAGRAIYVAKCAACHGAEKRTAGGKLPGPPLFADPDSTHIKTIGNYWPYATTIYDYVRRSMPYNAPGSLTNSEVYALSAYLLHVNGIIDSLTIVNQTNLSRIQLPARQRFVKDDRRGGSEIK